MRKILIILSLLLIIVSCNNSTEPEDNTLYVGESYLNNGLYLSAPDTISIDDTLEIITSLPKQKYRLKGRMFIFSSGFHDSVIRLLTMAKSAIRHNMSNDIPHLDFPVCLVWGKQDNVTPPEVAKEFHSLFKRSDLFWIDKCGHSPMWEHPKEFAEILCNWLNTNIK